MSEVLLLQLQTSVEGAVVLSGEVAESVEAFPKQKREWWATREGSMGSMAWKWSLFALGSSSTSVPLDCRETLEGSHVGTWTRVTRQLKVKTSSDLPALRALQKIDLPCILVHSATHLQKHLCYLALSPQSSRHHLRLP